MRLPQLRVVLRPNNQISIGLQNCPKAIPDIYKSRTLTDLENKKENGLRLHRRLAAIARTKEKRYDYFGGLIVRLKAPRKRIDYALPKLDLIQKFQRRLKPFKAAGFVYYLCNLLPRLLEYFSQYRLNPPKKFSYQAGQSIREAGAAMEIVSNGQVHLCHCTTLTLPANTREAMETLAAYSSYAVNRLFQVLRRKYRETDYWFFCWEFQKRGALHLHIAHYHPDETEGMLIGNLLIEQWHKILEDISENSGVCMFTSATGDRCAIRTYHQHHSQPMRKSVAGYFSKYAGKATKCDENSYVAHHAETLSPKRYWGSSFQLKAIVKENSYESLFDVGCEIEAESRYQQVLSIILKENIVQFNRYEFKKEIEQRQDYGFKGRTDRKCYRRIIAEGFREVFYVSPDCYQKLLNAIKLIDSYF